VVATRPKPFQFAPRNPDELISRMHEKTQDYDLGQLG
jgi:hypothetical protein